MTRSHPSDKDLLAYAESFVNTREPVNAGVARHVSECAPCRAEVEAVADSLSYVDEAGLLEPSRQLTASLLLAAKAERLGTSPAFDFLDFRPRLAWGTVAVTVLALAAVLSYTLRDEAGAPVAEGPVLSGQDTPPLNAAALPFNLKALPASGAELLTKAEGVLDLTPQSRWEREQQRKIRMLSEDIAAGLERLNRNPANVRAKEVVDSNGPLLLETLTIYYAGKSL